MGSGVAIVKFKSEKKNKSSKFLFVSVTTFNNLKVLQSTSKVSLLH